MRFYTVTLLAIHDKGGEQPNISVANNVAFLHDDQDIETEALAQAHELFPDSEGWCDHLVTHTEIETGVIFADRYRLTWSVEDVQVEAHRAQGLADQRQGTETGDR